MYCSASQLQWAKRLRAGRIPNIMTTSHQSSSPQAAVHTCVFPEFLLWEMSRVKHETGGNVHHCSTVCNILPHTALLSLQGKGRSGFYFFIFFFLCLNIPFMFTMQISSLLCMLIMVNSKMLIEKLHCVNKAPIFCWGSGLVLQCKKERCQPHNSLEVKSLDEEGIGYLHCSNISLVSFISN